jgi:hypothetical protein
MYSSGWLWGAIRRIKVVEGNCATRERIDQYATITRHPSSGNQMIQEPSASVRPQIVITDPMAARRGVDKPAIASINGDVADPAALSKEHQVSHRHRAGRRLYGDTGPCHLSRCAGQVDTLNSVDVLNKS